MCLWTLIENAKRNLQQKLNNKNNFSLTLIASTFSGFATGLITTPLDIVKTRYQLNFDSYKNLSIFGSLRKIYNIDGMKGLFKGNI